MHKQAIAVFNLQDTVDGFLLGDGSIVPGKNTARLRCKVKHEDFCRYMMSFFDKYNPTVSQNRDKAWLGSTKVSSELYEHYLRWIPCGHGSKKHRVPADVSVAPMSVLLWYLGDGRLRNCAPPGYAPSPAVDLCTDCFDPGDLENIIIPKMKNLDIDCYVGHRNRVCIRANAIGQFFEYIGGCPVPSLLHRFDISDDRKSSVRLSVASQILGVKYSRLKHLIFKNRLPCYRAQSNSCPRLLPEHLQMAKHLISIGELY